MATGETCSNCGKEFMGNDPTIFDGGSHTWFSCVGSDANCCCLPCLIEFIAKQKIEKILKEKGLGG